MTAPASLPEFIQLLKLHNDISSIHCPVSTDLEMAAICRAVAGSAGGGSALLFEQPEGFTTRVAANLFGSLQRNCLALGVTDMAELGGRFDRLLPEEPVSDFEAISSFLLESAELQRYTPRITDDPPLYQLELPGNSLMKLPFLQNWPGDGAAAGRGRYITLGQVVSSDPAGEELNYGIYRCQIQMEDRLAIHWSETSGAARHYQLYRQQQKPMPIAILLGGPPALTLASAWPLPDTVNELTFAGWMSGNRTPVTCCRHDRRLLVPAEGEIVLEGVVLPDQPVLEGPFGNHTGSYTAATLAVQARLVRICHREGAILPATVVGPPPQEDCFMMAGWERLLELLVGRLIPEVKGVHLPIPWIFKGGAIISVDSSSGRSATETVDMLWQLPWFRNSRLLLLVDHHTVPHDLLKVAWRVIHQADWQKGIITDQTGQRVAIVAAEPAPPPLSDLPEIEALINQRWKEYGLP